MHFRAASAHGGPQPSTRLSGSPPASQFINESLEEVHAGLQRLGGVLVVRHGEVAEVLSALAADLAAVGGIAQLLSHEETGTPAVVARNAAVAQWAQQHGVEWNEYKQTGALPATI